MAGIPVQIIPSPNAIAEEAIMMAAYSLATPSVFRRAAALKGHDDHSPAETADLSTLPIQTKRAAVFLARIARGE